MDDQEKQQLVMVHRAVFGFIDPATNQWVKGLVQVNAEMNKTIADLSDSIITRLGRLEKIGIVAGIAVALGTNATNIRAVFEFVFSIIPK